jgi:hypothetical protein
MTTTIRMSAPTPKSMPWPTPQRPAQAAPVRRESATGGDVPGVSLAGVGGITPSLYPPLNPPPPWYPPPYFPPFAGGDDL